MWRSVRYQPTTRRFPVLFLAAALGTACAPDGPLDIDEGVSEENGDGSGSTEAAAPSIVEQGVAGTNANHGSATSVSLPYHHPGGRLIVFSRHNGVEIGGISSTFNGQSIRLLASAEAGAPSLERAGYLFSADVGAGAGTIVVDLGGRAPDQRGIMAFSVAGSAGVRATATGGESGPGANGTVGLSLDSEEGDLVLGYVAWRFSDADVRSQPVRQSTELDDDDPTRQQAHSRAGEGGSTFLNVAFNGNPSSTVYLAVTLEPVAP